MINGGGTGSGVNGGLGCVYLGTAGTLFLNTSRIRRSPSQLECPFDDSSYSTTTTSATPYIDTRDCLSRTAYVGGRSRNFKGLLCWVSSVDLSLGDRKRLANCQYRN
ncbi:hypothetical protein BS50DRAFT_576373 [Corynespora cassiicola Philippines]|uniref:Uncharacterized protein n=1 Tax=Corynespora cassiicola Philippines TaxID=1448308 RepID=A0A2T2NE89_CORCC|nr:hypothetical protein BS50DRAFT_576373 [Corynespora cassiicola Philippines]